MIINFETHDEQKRLLLETINVFDGYFTFMVEVHSGSFEGKSSFYLLVWQLQKFVQDIAIMDKDLKGQAILDDTESDGFIKLEVARYGEVIVNGQVGGTHEDQFMRFRFETDQTILYPLQTQIEKVIKNNSRV